MFDIHIGISSWRESITRTRSKGLWDPILDRKTLVLIDGRKLSYFVDAPTNGLCGSRTNDLPHIFCFHAMFLSGNCFITKETPKDYVLVCVNRPGYFGSDPVHATNYTYEHFARDIEQLADFLQVKTFYVAGHSSGGPCALACAHYLPSRVLAVGILSGDPEYAHETVPSKRAVNAICLGYVLPFLLKWVLGCLPMAKNARKGLMNDYRLETTIYPFRTEDIIQPTIVFVGEKDSVLPLKISRHVHERLANASLNVVPKVGHLGLLRDNILSKFFQFLLNLHDLGPKAETMTDATATSSSSSSRSLEMC